MILSVYDQGQQGPLPARAGRCGHEHNQPRHEYAQRPSRSPFRLTQDEPSRSFFVISSTTHLVIQPVARSSAPCCHNLVKIALPLASMNVTPVKSIIVQFCLFTSISRQYELSSSTQGPASRPSSMSDMESGAASCRTVIFSISCPSCSSTSAHAVPTDSN